MGLQEAVGCLEGRILRERRSVLWSKESRDHGLQSPSELRRVSASGSGRA